MCSLATLQLRCGALGHERAQLLLNIAHCTRIGTHIVSLQKLSELHRLRHGLFFQMSEYRDPPARVRKLALKHASLFACQRFPYSQHLQAPLNLLALLGTLPGHCCSIASACPSGLFVQSPEA